MQAYPPPFSSWGRGDIGLPPPFPQKVKDIPFSVSLFPAPSPDLMNKKAAILFSFPFPSLSFLEE